MMALAIVSTMTSRGAKENAQKKARAAPVVEALSLLQKRAAQLVKLPILFAALWICEDIRYSWKACNTRSCCLGGCRCCRCFRIQLSDESFSGAGGNGKRRPAPFILALRELDRLIDGVSVAQDLAYA